MSEETLHYRGGPHLVDTTGDVELTKKTDIGDEVDNVFQDEIPVHGLPENHNIDTKHMIGSARTPWYGTTIVLLSEVMGTGILSLPYASKILGWGTSLMALPLFAIIASYSGWLLWRVQQERSSLHSYADAAKALVGPRFGSFTEISMLVSWGALAIYYMIAASDGLEDVISSNMCQYQRTFLVVLILVVPCQCRDFYSISKYLSLPSTLAIVFSVLIIASNLLFFNTNETPVTTTVAPPSDTTLFDYLMALSAFCFAYQGQSIYLELISEMKEPRHFPRAVNLSYAIMCLLYGLTVCVAYSVKGSEIPGFLPDILPQGGAARATVGAMVVLHITVSYVIAGQPLHKWFHATFFPSTVEEESKRASFHWFLVTFGYLLVGWVLSNCIPFFADVQALIGSLFGAPIMFAWPVVFVVAALGGREILVNDNKRNSLWKQGFRNLGWGHAAIGIFFLAICTPVFCILGTTGAIKSIVEDSAKAAIPPFHCE